MVLTKVTAKLLLKIERKTAKLFILFLSFYLSICLSLCYSILIDVPVSLLLTLCVFNVFFFFSMLCLKLQNLLQSSTAQEFSSNLYLFGFHCLSQTTRSIFLSLTHSRKIQPGSLSLSFSLSLSLSLTHSFSSLTHSTQTPITKL